MSFTKTANPENDLLMAMQKLSQMMAIDKRDVSSSNTIDNFYQNGSSPNKNIRKGKTNSDIRSDNKPDTNRIHTVQTPRLGDHSKTPTKENNNPFSISPERVDKSAIYLSKEAMDSLLGKTIDNSQCNTQRSTQVINRLYELNTKKNEKIAAMQYKKFKEELSVLKPKPEISLTSRLIAQQKISKPIDKRVNEVLSHKEEKIKRLKDEVEENRRASEAITLTFKPEINKKDGMDRARTPKEVQNQLLAWHNKRNEILQKEQYETITKELEGVTFKPAINENSKKLVAQKTPNNHKVKIEDRLNSKKEELEEKKRLLEEKIRPSFKPHITEKSALLLKNKQKESVKPWQSRSKSPMNKSYIDPSLSSSIMNYRDSEDMNINKTNRSITPEKSNKKNLFGEKKPLKSTRINEVQYTREMDFLLSKVI